MLTLKVGEQEWYDEDTNRFFDKYYCIVQLEHSLASVSKWESIHKIPFFGDKEQTEKERLSYIECMVVGEKPPEDFLLHLNESNIKDITKYVSEDQTATEFVEELPSKNKPGIKEKITSELIYYWMVAFSIPWEAQHWHLSRLFALIRIYGIKNAPPEKLTPEEKAIRYRDLNEKRKRELGTRG